MTPPLPPTVPKTPIPASGEADLPAAAADASTTRNRKNLSRTSRPIGFST